MSIARHHAEWLSLLEISGPFLSTPVLMGVFPQELDADYPHFKISSDSQHRIYQTYHETDDVTELFITGEGSHGLYLALVTLG